MSLGASRSQMLAIVLRETWSGVIASTIMGFSRALGELGIAMMVGGNIAGYTRVMTTAIALGISKGGLRKLSPRPRDTSNNGGFLNSNQTSWRCQGFLECELRITLNKVWFRYPGSGWVLRNISEVFRCGETVLIRGPNGSGKTPCSR